MTLLYELTAPRNSNKAGYIAVVDRDKGEDQRLAKLRAAREQHRNHPQSRRLPTALGESVPHFEAWLLDDPAAVRAALALETNCEIPAVTRCDYPKDDLDQLIAASDACRERQRSETLEAVAAKLQESRCNNRATTGFADFLADVRAEFCERTEAGS